MGSCADTPKVINSNVKPIKGNKDNTSDKNTLETYYEINGNHNSYYSLSLASSLVKFNTDSKSGITFKLEPDIEEYIIPVYLKANDTITIHIKGFWSFLPEYGFVDFKGHPESTVNNMNIGQLVYKIQGGLVHPIVNEKSVITAESNGQLILYSNNDHSQSQLVSQCQGGLEITIEGVSIETHTQLSTLLQWSKWLKKLVLPDYLTNNEAELIDLINRVRVNPVKFALQYIDILNKPNQREIKETYDFLMNYTSMPSLEISQALSMASIDHAEDIGKRGVTGHISSSDEVTIRERIERKTKRKVKYFGENILYGKRLPWSIVIDMLIGFGLRINNNRMNILNEKYTKIGLAIRRHLAFNWICVIVFGTNIKN